MLTRKRVLNEISQYLSGQDSQLVMPILDAYGVQPLEPERERAHLAIPKLGDGDTDRLAELVKPAKQVFCDILAYAEHPEEMRIGFEGLRRMPESIVKAARKGDREQYLRWLEGRPIGSPEDRRSPPRGRTPGT